MASVTREYVKVAGLVTELYRSRPQSGAFTHSATPMATNQGPCSLARMYNSKSAQCYPAGISKLQICIFPGNPGNAGFYTYFLSCLDRHFHQAVDIWAVSHVGHDPEAHNGNKVS